ncbi:hypothetical protein C8J57DRAFT_1219121 [Mycena rebaudengoi]|nr:hypothetical protein C8J57DRAFT_1219121 [Mycena rebaudengoi]
MSSPVTRSSVLGKRPHNPDPSTPAHSDAKLQLQTPDRTPIPKRPRTSGTVLDGDGNKENVPPFTAERVTSPPSPRAARSLRRTTTSDGSPSHGRQAVTRRASTSAIVPATPTCRHRPALSCYSSTHPLLTPFCPFIAAADMAGRDSERAAISAFFSSLETEADLVEYTSLYISGSPGTGKTALVNSVISINCMALNSVDALWERLVEELGGTSDKKRKTAGRVKKAQGRDAGQPFILRYILILDELDHIAPNAQSLSSLFSLSSSRASLLRVVGIANTHTLTASSSTAFVSSSKDVRTLHFAPYTPAQLLQILQSRLAPLYSSELDDTEGSEAASQAAKKFFSPPALNLLTKKVAALTGDVRSLFEVLRGAIDLAVSPAPQSPTRSDENPLNPTVQSAITPAHILAALKAYTPSSTPVPRVSTTSAPTPVAANSEVVSKIRSLGLQARLVLLALLLASKRIEAGLVPLIYLERAVAHKAHHLFVSYSCLLWRHRPQPAAHILHRHPVALMRRRVFSPCRASEFGDLVGLLEGVRHRRVLLGGGKRAFGRSASFRGGGGGGGGAGDVQLAAAVRTEEVLRALGIGMGEAVADEDVAAEEVNAIWLKENGRLARDASVRDNKAKKERVTAGFDDAMED